MKLVYFATLRERIGKPDEDLEPPAGIDTVAKLIDWLKSRDAVYAAALGEPKMVRVAVNMEYAQGADPVRPGDEVAFFPPVTGG